MKLKWFAVSLILHLSLFLVIRIAKTKSIPIQDIEIQVLDSRPASKQTVNKFDKFKPKFDPTSPGSQIERDPTGSSSNYIPDLTSSQDETILSTKEFKYYTYFNRIRQQLDSWWRPAVKAKVLEMQVRGHKLEHDAEYVTRCYVTLDHVGRVTSIKVVRSAGVQELDDVAVATFRSIGVFPNPPPEMVNEQGVVAIQWDFVVESDSQQQRLKKRHHP